MNIFEVNRIISRNENYLIEKKKSLNSSSHEQTNGSNVIICNSAIEYYNVIQINFLIPCSLITPLED